MSNVQLLYQVTVTLSVFFLFQYLGQTLDFKLSIEPDLYLLIELTVLSQNKHASHSHMLSWTNI